MLINQLREDTLNALLNWRDLFVKGYWEIGDLVNEEWSYVVANNIQAMKAEVQACFGEVMGRSARTIRVYADTAEFYGKDAREKYNVLPYKHFIFAMTYPAQAATWMEILDYSLSEFFRRGHAAGWRDLQEYFQTRKRDREIAEGLAMGDYSVLRQERPTSIRSPKEILGYGQVLNNIQEFNNRHASNNERDVHNQTYDYNQSINEKKIAVLRSMQQDLNYIISKGNDRPGIVQRLAQASTLISDAILELTLDVESSTM